MRGEIRGAGTSASRRPRTTGRAAARLLATGVAAAALLGAAPLAAQAAAPAAPPASAHVATASTDVATASSHVATVTAVSAAPVSLVVRHESIAAFRIESLAARSSVARAFVDGVEVASTEAYAGAVLVVPVRFDTRAVTITVGTALDVDTTTTIALDAVEPTALPELDSFDVVSRTATTASVRFTAVAGATVEIRDIRSGTVLAVATADAQGRGTARLVIGSERTALGFTQTLRSASSDLQVLVVDEFGR